VVLRALIGEDAAVTASVAPPATGGDGAAGGGLGLDDVEADEVEEHLRGLGYIE
jgi:hypothetical protein